MKRIVWQYQQSKVKFFKIPVEFYVTLSDMEFTLAKTVAVDLLWTDEEEIEMKMNEYSKKAILLNHRSFLEVDGSNFKETNPVDCNDAFELYLTIAKKVVQCNFPELM